MIVDASLIEVPRQRNTREENERIKNGETPEAWKEAPAKLRQKDVDAKWTKKNGENYYGYKNHVSTDVSHKLIHKCEVTSASVHDSQVLEKLLDENNKKQTIWADSAYTGEGIENLLKERGIRNRIHAKGYRGRPLTTAQQEGNRKKSRIRARVEHIFGFMTTSMKAGWIRCIGIVRARSRLFLQNLVYNMKRYQFLERTV
jgi:IS5 family transposase